jgi:iron complex transport system substrate-binding protein
MDTKHLTPLEIDELVRARLAAGDELYSLDDAALARCNPDLILSQDLCRVCAVPSGEVDLAVARLNCQATVLQIDPHSLVEVINSVQTVADAAGVPERGHALVRSLHQRLTTLRERTDSHLAGQDRPTVFVLEWVDPPFVGGHWVPDLVVAAGGQPVLALPGERSVPSTWEAICEADPDHIIVSPCGYGLAGAREQALKVLDQMPTRATIWAIDADAVVVRPGPRLVDGAEAIAAALFGPEIAGLPALPAEVIQRLR